MTASIFRSRSRLLFAALLTSAVGLGGFAAVAAHLQFSPVSALPTECRDGAGYLQMTSDKVGWLKGATTLWHTRDGGLHWENRKLPSTDFIADYARVQFADDRHGWMFWVAPHVLYETTDGGLTWAERSVPHFDGSIHAAWWLPKANRMWVAGGLYKPSDSPDAPNYALKKLESGGWAILHPIVFSLKRDGGAWEAQEPQPESCCLIGEVRFWDDKHGYAVGDGPFYYTDDGGGNWATGILSDITEGADSCAEDAEQPTVFFLDPSNGWMSLSRRCFYRTTDGGKNWLQIGSAGAPYFDRLQFLTAARGLAISRRSELYETFDGGRTWTIIKTPFRARDLSCLSAAKCWVLSDTDLYRFSLD